MITRRHFFTKTAAAAAGATVANSLVPLARADEPANSPPPEPVKSADNVHSDHEPSNFLLVNPEKTTPQSLLPMGRRFRIRLSTA